MNVLISLGTALCFAYSFMAAWQGRQGGQPVAAVHSCGSAVTHVQFYWHVGPLNIVLLYKLVATEPSLSPWIHLLPSI